MPDHPSFDPLKRRFALLSDLAQAAGLLVWDQNTYMPAGGAEARAQQLASLSRVQHEKLTDGQVGQWLEDMTGTFSEDSDEGALVARARRAYERATKLPEDFVEALSRQASRAQGVWAEARQAKDFALFAPELVRILELKRREADYYGYEDHPYDALHDTFEEGSTSARLKALFGPLRDELVALVKAIADSPVVIDDDLVYQSFDESRQEQFGIEAVKGFGYDLMRGRLDRTVHPFAQSMGKSDVRITARYHSGFLNQALFSIMHEAGHAMYEQGIADTFQRSPLGDSASLGVHESQSRLWENLVGRSYAFWEGAFPRLQELFPEQLGNASVDAFYGAVNRVEPSLIRVEADEVTYNLHIMARFELELALLEGTLEVKDVPEAWNAKYEDYLGLTPPDDALGCLQDVHWSVGLFGYFPTYTLGNLMSVQLFDTARAAHPKLEAELRAGEFSTLLGWLRDNVHRHGAKFPPEVLLERATGSRLDAQPYLDYLRAKFGSLYALNE